MSRTDIMRAVWNREPHAEQSNIVDVHVRYLRVKLAKVDPTLSIETVRGVGYVMRRQPAE